MELCHLKVNNVLEGKKCIPFLKGDSVITISIIAKDEFLYNYELKGFSDITK